MESSRRLFLSLMFQDSLHSLWHRELDTDTFRWSIALNYFSSMFVFSDKRFWGILFLTFNLTAATSFWTCPGFWGYCYFFVRPGAKVVKPFWHFCNGSGNRNKHAGRWNLPSVRNLPPPLPLGETWLWIQLLRILHSVISNKGFALPSRVNSSCSCINNYMVGVHQPPWQTYCSKCHHGRWKFPAIASFRHFSILWLLRQVKAID